MAAAALQRGGGGWSPGFGAAEGSWRQRGSGKGEAELLCAGNGAAGREGGKQQHPQQNPSILGRKASVPP